MKRNLIYALLLLLFGITTAGCSKGPDPEEIAPITLDKQQMWLLNTRSLDAIRICSGNGDYTLVYPKKITIDDVEVDYSELIIKLSLDEISGIITVERKLLTGQDYPDKRVEAFFIVKDCKGKRKLFGVWWGGEMHSGPMGLDIKKAESRLLKDKDYWQE